MTDPAQSPLGRACRYISQYDPSLLCPLPRQPGRDSFLAAGAALPFSGTDTWNAMELSWLDSRGKPVVMAGSFVLPAHSPFLIESKSLKLYLNSFNQTRFASCDAVRQKIAQDLSAAAACAVAVELIPLETLRDRGLYRAEGICIDHQEVAIDIYDPPSADFLTSDPQQCLSETLYSQLLKSNCPVTGQPDWGTLVIDYTGPRIDRAGLLRYLCSFRQHQDFHEHCVERVFMDIRQRCATGQLTVHARYLRRGGLDINPWRTDCGRQDDNRRLPRQ